MNNQLLNRPDLDFLLHTWLKVEPLADRETVDAVLDLSEGLATEQFLPHLKRCDVEEPQLVDGEVRVCSAIGGALARYAELGLFAAGFPVEQGGLALPAVVCAASYAYFAAANPDTAAYPLLTVANARLIAGKGRAGAQHKAYPGARGAARAAHGVYLFPRQPGYLSSLSPCLDAVGRIVRLLRAYPGKTAAQGEHGFPPAIDVLAI